VRRTSLRSYILRRVPTYTAGLTPKWQWREARSAPAAGVMGAERFESTAHVPSFLHLATRSHLYRGLGSKVAMAGSKGQPVLLLPRPYRGIKPPAGLTPSPAGLTPSPAGLVPSCAGLFPSHPGLVPSHAGMTPSRAGLVPSHAGLFPSHAGIVPSHPGMFPNRAGMTPNRFT
jgi:hypothetical protein